MLVHHPSSTSSTSDLALSFACHSTRGASLGLSNCECKYPGPNVLVLPPLSSFSLLISSPAAVIAWASDSITCNTKGLRAHLLVLLVGLYHGPMPAFLRISDSHQRRAHISTRLTAYTYWSVSLRANQYCTFHVPPNRPSGFSNRLVFLAQLALFGESR